MDGTEFGAYMLLIVACYQTSTHRLPEEDSRLGRMARVTPKVWQRVRNVVMNKFIHRSDLNASWYEHERVNLEVVKYKSISTTNQANALKRWETEKRLASEPHSERNATHNPIPESKINPLTPLEEKVGFNNLNVGRAFDIIPLLSESALAAAKRIAPRWDIYQLARIYNEGSALRGKPENPDGAFINWVKAYTKGKLP